MPQFNKTMMCAECPFRANAPAGWLGPDTPQEVHDKIHGEAYYFCHMDVTKQLKETGNDKADPSKTEHCVGFLRYRATVFKMGNQQDQIDRMKELKEIPDVSTIAPFKFLEYHNAGVLKRKKPRRKVSARLSLRRARS